jgi:hypothetical protein
LFLRSLHALEAVEKPQRNPIHCIIVLDVSGSMDSSATQAAADSSSHESQVNFTRLDLAKHSSKVIVEVCGGDDSVTIVSFSSEAKVKLAKTLMTADGKCKRSVHPRAVFSRAAQGNFRRRQLSTACERKAPLTSLQPTSSPFPLLWKTPPAKTYTLLFSQTVNRTTSERFCQVSSGL